MPILLESKQSIQSINLKVFDETLQVICSKLPLFTFKKFSESCIMADKAFRENHRALLNALVDAFDGVATEILRPTMSDVIQP